MDEFRSRLAHAAGWATAVFAGCSLSDWGILIGIATSLATFVVNWYYAKKKADAVARGMLP